MRIRTWCLAAVILAGAAGCSNGKSSEPAAGGGAPSTATGGVAATSRWDAGPRAAESKADEELAEAGEKLFSAKGCTACHAFGRKSAGPDLAGVSMRRTEQWMEQQILHPDVMVKEDPISRQLFAQFALQMPNQGLTADEAKAVDRKSVV